MLIVIESKNVHSSQEFSACDCSEHNWWSVHYLVVRGRRWTQKSRSDPLNDLVKHWKLDDWVAMLAHDCIQQLCDDYLPKSAPEGPRLRHLWKRFLENWRGRSGVLGACHFQRRQNDVWKAIRAVGHTDWANASLCRPIHALHRVPRDSLCKSAHRAP